MTLDTGQGGSTPDPMACRNCGSPLAYDQRYCLNCGERRSRLPRPIAQAIGGMFEHGGKVKPPGDPCSPPTPQAPGKTSPFGPGMPGPLPSAAAVLAMLAFGIVVGSFEAPAVLETLARGPLTVFMPTVHHASAVDNSSGDSGSSAAGASQPAQQAAQQQTVVQQVAATGNTGLGNTGTGNTGTGAGNTGSGSPPSYNGLPPIPHIWVITLSGQRYNDTFSPISSDTYFNKTLARQGDLLVNYYGVAGGQLANEVAMVSGQGPTKQTSVNCPVYKNISPGSTGANGQILGNGCVYPKAAKTVGEQLTTSGHGSWKAYIEGIGSGKGDAKPCTHPKTGQGNGAPPSPKHPYAVWSNPFVYFAAITGSSDCATQDVGLDQLTTDIKTEKKTPSLSFIFPGPCDNGNPHPCAPGAQAGLAPAEKFLKSIVPKIEASPGYKIGGMIVITFDEAPQTGPQADRSSCCDTPAYPNVPSAPASAAAAAAGLSATSDQTAGSTSTTTSSTSTASTPAGTTTSTTSSTTTSGTTTTTTTSATSTATAPIGGGLTNPTGGGGQVGALLISPWVKPNTNDVLNYYNHYSLLASIENLFGLGRIGYTSSITLQTIPIGDFTGSGPS